VSVGATPSSKDTGDADAPPFARACSILASAATTTGAPQTWVSFETAHHNTSCLNFHSAQPHQNLTTPTEEERRRISIACSTAAATWFSHEPDAIAIGFLVGHWESAAASRPQYTNGRDPWAPQPGAIARLAALSSICGGREARVVVGVHGMRRRILDASCGGQGPTGQAGDRVVAAWAAKARRRGRGLKFVRVAARPTPPSAHELLELSAWAEEFGAGSDLRLILKLIGAI